MMRKPRAILFDLDDTILPGFPRPDMAWREVVAEILARDDETTIARVADAIRACSRAFWADPERHKAWRLRMGEARRMIVAGAFADMARAGQQQPAADPDAIANRFSAYCDEQISIQHDAHRVLDELRRRGLGLALVTNGATHPQRAKIERFALVHRFDHIQIEEDVGFGKPDERAYAHALAALGVAPAQAWMVGDNLEWEVAAPQRLGMFAVWFDHRGRGLPPDSDIRPDLIVTGLSDLLPHIP